MGDRKSDYGSIGGWDMTGLEILVIALITIPLLLVLELGGAT
jgi:hypothetical protein